MTPTAGVVYVRRHDTPMSDFSTSSRGSSDSMERSFLKRMFAWKTPQLDSSSHRQLPSLGKNENGNESDTIFIMTPNPACHPLLSKPVARDEIRPRTNPRIIDPPRLKATIKKIEKPEQLEDSLTCDERPTTMTGIEMYKRNLRDREQAAMSAAIDRNYVQEWGFFIKCYSEGRFNVSNPPDPPPRRPEFNRLTAPAPPSERQRLKAVKSFNVPLPAATVEKLNRLALLARKVFQTRMATISLVDENLEVYKAENSFGHKYIDRADSIGAHVLLASEPMVVLDTVKDWRFRGNPLVQDSPHIRFYAAAPIATSEGYPIGVFAVFDTQPRSAFPVTSRRNLMDFAKLAMTEFEIATEQHDLLKKHIPTKIIEQIKVQPAEEEEKDNSDNESILSRRSRQTAKLLKGIEENAEMMPPLSPFLADEASELLLDSPTMPMHPQDSFVAKPRAENSNNTPDNPTEMSSHSVVSIGGDNHAVSIPSHDRFLVVSEPTESLPAPSDNFLSPPTTLSNPLPRYKQNRPHPLQTLSNPSLIELPPPPATPITPPIPQASPGSQPRLSEAKFATALIARSLDYDFVYLLRVTSLSTPDSPLVPIDRYRPKTAINTKVLVAHGLPDPPPKFDAALHLRALRSQGGLVFQNPVSGGERDEVGFQVGIMLPLAREGGCNHQYQVECTSEQPDACTGDGEVDGGIVLAAFSAKAAATNMEYPIRPDEVKFLREFGDAMKDIFVMADKAPKRLR